MLLGSCNSVFVQIANIKKKIKKKKKKNDGNHGAHAQCGQLVIERKVEFAYMFANSSSFASTNSLMNDV